MRLSRRLIFSSPGFSFFSLLPSLSSHGDIQAKHLILQIRVVTEDGEPLASHQLILNGEKFDEVWNSWGEQDDAVLRLVAESNGMQVEEQA